MTKIISTIFILSLIAFGSAFVVTNNYDFIIPACIIVAFFILCACIKNYRKNKGKQMMENTKKLEGCNHCKHQHIAGIFQANKPPGINNFLSWTSKNRYGHAKLPQIITDLIGFKSLEDAKKYYASERLRFPTDAASYHKEIYEILEQANDNNENYQDMSLEEKYRRSVNWIISRHTIEEKNIFIQWLNTFMKSDEKIPNIEEKSNKTKHINSDSLFFEEGFLNRIKEDLCFKIFVYLAVIRRIEGKTKFNSFKRKFNMMCHPDKNHSEEKLATESFQKIAPILEEIGDKDLSHYDDQLKNLTTKLETPDKIDFSESVFNLFNFFGENLERGNVFSSYQKCYSQNYPEGLEKNILDLKTLMQEVKKQMQELEKMMQEQEQSITNLEDAIQRQQGEMQSQRSEMQRQIDGLKKLITG